MRGSWPWTCPMGATSATAIRQTPRRSLLSPSSLRCGTLSTFGTACSLPKSYQFSKVLNPFVDTQKISAVSIFFEVWHPFDPHYILHTLDTRDLQHSLLLAWVVVLRQTTQNPLLLDMALHVFGVHVHACMSVCVRVRTKQPPLPLPA